MQLNVESAYLCNMLDDIIHIPFNIGDRCPFPFTESMSQMIVTKAYHVIFFGTKSFTKLVVPLTMFPISMAYKN